MIVAGLDSKLKLLGMFIPGTYPAPKKEKKPVVYEGMRTPWGKADSAGIKSPGIGWVSTPGHGGYKLDASTNKRIPECFRKAGGWYEEDIDWAIVVLILGIEMGETTETIAHARNTVRGWYPDAFSAYFGVVVTAENSHVIREREAREAAKGNYLVLSCFGDWAIGVPDGMVGVCASIDGIRERSAERFFLVTSEEYDAIKGPIGVRVLPESAKPVDAGPNGRCPFGPSKSNR